MMCIGLTSDTKIMMKNDLEVLFLADVLDFGKFGSRNLILCSTIAGQVANGRRWTINARIPANQYFDTRNITKSVFERP